MASAQESKNTIRNSGWTLGYGHISVYDEYLSPSVYKGSVYRIDYNSMRYISTNTNKVSLNWTFMGEMGITDNASGTNSIFYASVRPGMGIYYHFRPLPNLKIMTGGIWDLIFANKYSFSNGNNPYSADLSTHLNAAGMAQYSFKIKTFPIILRYSASVPMAGVMFVPEYGASYYEMFALGKLQNAFHFASFHNYLAFKSSLTADLLFKKWIVRIAYYHDYQKNNANSLHFESLQNVFSIGTVVNFAVFDRNKRKIPPSFSDVNQ
jgi:hypothetical protein